MHAGFKDARVSRGVLYIVQTPPTSVPGELLTERNIHYTPASGTTQSVMFFRNILQKLREYFVNEDEQPEKAEQYARDVLSYIEDGKWASLQNRLVFPLSYFFPKNLLQSGWNTITAAVGPLRRVGDPVLSVGWVFTSVRTPVQFGRAKLAITFWMTPSGKLLTLQLAPQPSTPWKAPPYGSPDAEEVPLTLLSRGLRRVHATLTLPHGRHKVDKGSPCVILIGGSGPVDRDSTVGASKPFKDLALGLTERGIAVCRFDKLGSTLLGKLTISKKTTTLSDEYVYHVLDAVRQVRRNPEIDTDRIILLGHSLGTLIAAQLVSIDASLAGCILMATPAEPVYRCAIRQLQYLAALDSADSNNSEAPPEAPADESNQIKELRRRAELADSTTLDMSTPASKLPFDVGPAYWLECRTFDALSTLRSVRKPVLVLQGARDYQVTVEQDYAKFHERFHRLPNFDFHLYEKLNHLFIPGQGRSTPLEYEIPGNVSVEVIDNIERWINGVS